MGQLLRRSLSTQKAGRRWSELLGYSLEDLARHLERQFEPGMTWQNIGQWHIDHVVPLASFAFASDADPDFRAAWALTNLRPLWATANLRKGASRAYLL